MNMILIAMSALFTFNSLAAEVKYQVDGDKGYVISQDDRKTAAGWKNILQSRVEIVRKGIINHEYIEYANLLKDSIDLEDLEQFQFRDMYVYEPGVSIVGNAVRMPFALSLKIFKDNAEQTTLNTSGTLDFVFEDGQVIDIKLEYFSDSNAAEEIVLRKMLGSISKYDGEYLETSVNKVLALYLEQNAKELSLLVEITNNIKNAQVQETLQDRTNLVF